MSQDRTLLLQTLGNNIRAERKKSNITIEKLAEDSNVSIQTIKDIEHAKRACQIDTLLSIASALGLSHDYLLGFYNIAKSSSQPEPDFKSLYNALNDKQKDFLKEFVKLMIWSSFTGS